MTVKETKSTYVTVMAKKGSKFTNWWQSRNTIIFNGNHSQDLMCYFYLAARALPKRIGVSGTDTVRGGAARWRPRLQFRAPRDGYRWLLWNLIMCRMPALTQRPLHTVICNQKENNFVKYWKSLLDLCCRCIILASNHEPLLQNFGQR